MKLPGIFRRSNQPNIDISAPHREDGPVRGATAKVAQRGMASLESDAHKLRNAKIGRPNAGEKQATGAGEKHVKPAGQKSICNIVRLQHVYHDVRALADLRDQADLATQYQLDKTLANAFMIAVAVEAVRTLVNHRPFIVGSKFHFDLSDTADLNKFDKAMFDRYDDLQATFNVSIHHLSSDWKTCEYIAQDHIRMLATSIIYDLGGTIDPQKIASSLKVEWSPEAANAILLETFAPQMRPDALTNLASVLDVLANASRFRSSAGSANSHAGAAGPSAGQHRAPPPSGSRSESPPPTPPRSGPSTPRREESPPSSPRGRSSPRSEESPPSSPRWETPPSTAHTAASSSSSTTSTSSERDRVLEDLSQKITNIIGKRPPALSVEPRCGRSNTGWRNGPGNLTNFFNLTPNSTAVDAYSQAREQWKQIMRIVHPDRAATQNSVASEAYTDVAKRYTGALKELENWVNDARV